MQTIFFLASVIVYLAIMVKLTEGGCNNTGGLAMTLLQRKCQDDDDCTQKGMKCIDTGVDGMKCIKCPCNNTEECIVAKKGGRYKFHSCDCADGSYGDRCHCQNCNCDHHHPNCDEGWKHHNLSCYRVFPENLDFPGAFGKCVAEGGRLVVIDHHETNHFLTDAYMYLSGTFWIGAGYVSPPGWVWALSFIPVGPYTNWAAGEATNPGCAYMKIEQGKGYNGLWFSGVCTQERNFICENAFH